MRRVDVCATLDRIVKHSTGCYRSRLIFTPNFAGILGVAAVTSCVATVTSCVVSATKKTPAVSSKKEAPMYRFVGRVEREPSGQVKYAWSGTGFVANFRGTGATVLLADDKNEHQVIVDGKILDKVVTRRKTTRYPLVSGLPSGDHQIELYRRTEALFGNTTFLGLEIEGGALIAEESKPRRRIELIGDSISCGYGNLGDSVNCGFSADTENHYESYGATLARTFSAEISTVAWSGRGIVRNFNGEIGEKMGALYDRVLPSESSSKWSADVPYDVVIINLGTNDFSTDPDPSEEEFATAYGTLLELSLIHI